MSGKTQTLVGVNEELGFDYQADHDPPLSDREVLAIQDRYLVEQLRVLVDERAIPPPGRRR